MFLGFWDFLYVLGFWVPCPCSQDSDIHCPFIGTSSSVPLLGFLVPFLYSWDLEVLLLLPRILVSMPVFLEFRVPSFCSSGFLFCIHFHGLLSSMTVLLRIWVPSPLSWDSIFFFFFAFWGLSRWLRILSVLLENTIGPTHMKSFVWWCMHAQKHCLVGLGPSYRDVICGLPHPGCQKVSKFHHLVHWISIPCPCSQGFEVHSLVLGTSYSFLLFLAYPILSIF